MFVEPTDDHSAEATGFGVPISGSSAEIAGAINRFGELGVKRVELILWPANLQSLAAVEPVLQLLDR